MEKTAYERLKNMSHKIEEMFYDLYNNGEFMKAATVSSKFKDFAQILIQMETTKEDLDLKKYKEHRMKAKAMLEEMDDDS